MSDRLGDAAAERAVLAGICTFGGDAYLDVADLLSNASFTVDSNQSLWSCLERIFRDSPQAKIDYPSILAAAKSLGVAHVFDKTEEKQHLRAIMNFPVKLENVRVLGGIVKKLEVARQGYRCLRLAEENIEKVTGKESIDQIIGMVEQPIVDWTTYLAQSNSDGPQHVGDGLRDYAEYLAANKCEVVGISSGFRNYDRAIGGGFRPGTVNVIGARPKVGKAQSLDSLVYTPDGPKQMRDIVVGDEICTPTGTSTVIAIHPQGDKEIYRVIFSDGDSVECCQEHLWEVKGHKRKKHEVISTAAIAADLKIGDGRAKWSVKLPTACYYRFRKTPLDPYLLGVIIGDGSTMGTGITLTTADAELACGVSIHLERPYCWRKQKSKFGYYLTRGRTGGKSNLYKDILRHLKLDKKSSHNKFVPDIYKINSESVRWAVLQGLMDTDGYIDRRGNLEYATTSSLLAKDVKEIVQSLGGLCKIVSRITSCKEKRFPSFRLYIRFNDSSRVFRLSRKMERSRLRRKEPLKRTIKRIEYVGVKPAQCITISDNNGLYLTDNHIVTHNSLLANNIGMRVASGSGYDWPKFNRDASIPVLQLDTEMTREDQWVRQLAFVSGVPINDIETGKYANDARKKRLIAQAIDRLEKMPYDFLSIAGQPFEETVATMRRWMVKKVGLNDDGSAKPCLVVFDYLKLMSSDSMESKNLAEFQVLGFMMTGLHNFAVRYKVPILTFIQLNRDGINVEDTSVASGSDRIIWLCSNFSIYKKKTDEEMAEQAGGKVIFNRKLVPIVARHGAGLDDGDYIHMMSRGEIATIVEGPTRNQPNIASSGQHKGIIVDDTTSQDEIQFVA